MFSVKFPTKAFHEDVFGFSVIAEEEFILELNLSSLDPLQRYADEKKLSLALKISNHLKYYYENTMDSMALVNAIDALDEFLDQCVERKKLEEISPSLNNKEFDDSLENGDYAVEIKGTNNLSYISVATFHQVPVYLDYSWLGRHLISIPFHWTGKSGFSTIHFDDSEIIRIIEKEPSLEGTSLVGYQLERILASKATLSSGTYKELPLKRDAAF
ncbi:hypothetical protein [aff. Roholtiella sp. LEGE 12411]|uniref:hypothetical protein n=1 Tax=aff. Roholtiella sp. LEGE 12411 TaxID=1828822 RepID=UPI00188164D2|nr:hypothetical protein [aff. Roholtiella sp. LEGE 12411]MBE9036036.1 hypothetical protein [aff. Roholtiella sp. LEGE 12411]